METTQIITLLHQIYTSKIHQLTINHLIPSQKISHQTTPPQRTIIQPILLHLDPQINHPILSHPNPQIKTFKKMHLSYPNKVQECLRRKKPILINKSKSNKLLVILSRMIILQK